MPSRTMKTLIFSFRQMKSDRGNRVSAFVTRITAMSVVMMAIVAVAAKPVSADLIYEFPNLFSDQNFHNLFGTISVLDTAPDDGVLLTSEITAFELNVTGNYNYGINSLQYSASAETVGTVLITPTAIILPPPNEASALDQNELFIRTDDNWFMWLRLHYALYGYHIDEDIYRSGIPNAVTPWDKYLTISRSADWFIAERVGESVPEPSTLALLLSSAVGLIAYHWRRK